MAKPSKPATPARPTPNVPMNIQAQLEAEAALIKSRIAAPSGDRIRFNGNKSMTAPDGSEGSELECVVLDFVSSNLYYDRPYNKDVVLPPACFAIGPEPSLLIPGKSAPVKQADTCSSCPMNQFGSALTGAGKACKNTRLVAVCPSDSEAGNTPIWILSIPPTSIKSFDAYVSSLATKNRTLPIGVVTRITLDPKSDYAAPRFEVVRPLSAEELPIFFEARAEAFERLTTEPDVSGYEPPKQQPRGARR